MPKPSGYEPPGYKPARRGSKARAMTCPALVAGALAVLNLAGCAEPARTGQPAFYRDLGSASARVDANEARAVISAYRMNAGLRPLALDPALSAAAEQEAAAMAQADKPAQADAVKARLARGGSRRGGQSLGGLSPAGGSLFRLARLAPARPRHEDAGRDPNGDRLGLCAGLEIPGLLGADRRAVTAQGFASSSCSDAATFSAIPRQRLAAALLWACSRAHVR